jgi:hypothetical protein
MYILSKLWPAEQGYAKNTARMACAAASETKEGFDSTLDEPGEHFIPPMTCTNLWREGFKKLATVGAPMLWGAGTAALIAVNFGADIQTSAIVAGGTALLGTALLADTFLRWSTGVVGMQIGTIQMVTQGIGAYGLRYGLEQLALHVNPGLNGHPGSPVNTTMPGNMTEAYGLDPQRIPPEWYSIMVLGVPFAVSLSALVFPVRGGTTSLDALVDRLCLDGSAPAKEDGSAGDVVERVGPRGRTALRWVVKASVVAGVLAVPIGFGMSGDLKTALRYLSTGNGIMFAAGWRDWDNRLMNGVTPGWPITIQRSDDGWLRQQEIKIPKRVLDALRKELVNPILRQQAIDELEENGEKVTDEKVAEIEGKLLENDQKAKAIYAEAERFLKDEYRDLFVQARFLSMFLYAGTGFFGLAAMRQVFSPPVKGVFAKDFAEFFKVTWPGLYGTSLVEASEEAAWHLMVRALASWRGLPFSISEGAEDSVDKVLTNLGEVGGSVTSALGVIPGMPAVRSCHESLYRPSKVSKEGKVTVSMSATLELHKGIRSFQNLWVALFFHMAGAATDPAVKTALFYIAATLNGLTHWRGNIVAQFLVPGLENSLRFDDQEAQRQTIAQEEIRANADNSTPATHRDTLISIDGNTDAVILPVKPPPKRRELVESLLPGDNGEPVYFYPEGSSEESSQSAPDFVIPIPKQPPSQKVVKQPLSTIPDSSKVSSDKKPDAQRLRAESALVLLDSPLVSPRLSPVTKTTKVKPALNLNFSYEELDLFTPRNEPLVKNTLSIIPDSSEESSDKEPVEGRRRAQTALTELDPDVIPEIIPTILRPLPKNSSSSSEDSIDVKPPRDAAE